MVSGTHCPYVGECVMVRGAAAPKGPKYTNHKKGAPWTIGHLDSSPTCAHLLIIYDYL